MKNWIIALAVVVISTVFCMEALAKPLTLNEISEAICRVKVSAGGGGYAQSSGTGTCIGETPDGLSYYILTNAHVVGRQSSGTVEFFKGGYKSNPLPAKVVWKAYIERSDVDFALMTVNKSYFGNYPPRIIQIAPKGYRPQVGNYIAAVGCPSARWAQGWEGHLQEDRQSRVIFAPAPVGGQSGSGIAVLIQGKDGEWYTRIGAILTWRIGDSSSSAKGGAIPISTLYDALGGRTHNYYRIPASYKQISTVDTGKVALGTDNRLYKVYLVNGEKTVRSENGTMNIVTWDYYNSAYCPSCPGGSCPPSSGSIPPSWGGGGGGWLRPSPSPSPQPQPRPNPGTVPPYTQPGNPYGVNPPNIPGIGAPWPGTTPPGTTPPGVTPDPNVPELPELPPLSQQLDELGQKFNALEAEKFELLQQIEKQAEADIAAAKLRDESDAENAELIAKNKELEDAAEASKAALPPLSKELDELGQMFNALEKEKFKLLQQIDEQADIDIVAEAERIAAEKAVAEAAVAEAAAAEQESTQEEVADDEVVPLGWFAQIKANLNTMFGGLLLGAGLGVLVFMWNKFLRNAVVQRIDSLQDYLENKVSEKWGPELGKESRDLMEGVEEALLGYADGIMEDMQARKQVAKSIAKGKPAERILNGSGLRSKLNVSEVMEAVREASKEVGGDDITTGVPQKVDEILNRVAKDKLKG